MLACTTRAEARYRDQASVLLLDYFKCFSHRWRDAYVKIATLVRWTHVGASRSDTLIKRLRLIFVTFHRPIEQWRCKEMDMTNKSFHERLWRCCAFLCKCRPRGIITSMNNDACLLLDYSTLQNSTPFTGCSKKLLKIKGRANLLAFYLLEHPCWKVVQNASLLHYFW